MKPKYNYADKIFNFTNSIIMIVTLIISLYPLYFVIIASISEPYEVVKGHVLLFPKGFTLLAYRNLFKYKEIWTGYRNTIIYTTCGIIISLFLTLTSAFVLSKKYFTCRKFFAWYFLFTMYFGGGLIPTYMLVRDIGLLNKAYTLIVLSSFSVFNMIITQTFFSSTIPDSLYESAQIDGSGEIRTFVSIALPLSKPIIAVMALYYGVSRWNGFFDALIYVSNKSLFPLQLVLRSILLLNQMSISQIDIYLGEEAVKDAAQRSYMAEAMKYSLIFIASFPLLAAYPFVQKHFIKGVMIGSIKG